MKYTLILSLFIMAACSKGHDVQPVDNTQTNLPLLNGTWKITAQTSNAPYDWDGDGDTETDLFATKPSCATGYKMILSYPSMAGTIDATCTIKKNITWNLSDHGNTLNWTIANASTVAEKIISISSTQLKTTSQEQPPNATTFTITTTYTKQ